MNLTSEQQIINERAWLPETWHTAHFHAMGSEMALLIETADAGDAAIAFGQVQALFAANEQALSRFRPDSELSRLNARSGQWVMVSDLLWDVLILALEMAAATGGHFDPTLLNALEQLGYTVSFEQLSWAEHSSPFPGSPSYPGRWRAVGLDRARQAVFLPVGVRVDLGGIAKGYTAQQAVSLMSEFGPGLVDAGGDLATGAAPAQFPGWPVAVSSPWTGPDEEPFDLCTMWLAEQAMATSGIDYRTWQRGDLRVHHLIDPATGAPADTDCLTVTVLAEDAIRAEAWATAALVAGADAGMEMLLDAQLAGLIVTQNGDVLLTSRMQERLQLLPTYQLPPLESNIDP